MSNHTTRHDRWIDQRTLYTRRRMPCCGCAHWDNANPASEHGYCTIHRRKTPAGYSCQSWQCSPELRGVV